MRSPRIRTTLSRIGAPPVPSISVPPTSASGPFVAERCWATAVTVSPMRTTSAERMRVAFISMPTGSRCRSIRDRRQRPVVLDWATRLEELRLGGAAAEGLRVAHLSLDGRDDFREGKRPLGVHRQIRVDRDLAVLDVVHQAVAPPVEVPVLCREIRLDEQLRSGDVDD